MEEEIIYLLGFLLLSIIIGCAIADYQRNLER